MNIRADNVTHERAYILWETNIETNGYVQYGTVQEIFSSASDDPCDSSGSSNTLSTTHCIELTDLNPGTQYYFQVASGATGGSVITSTSSFVTQDEPLSNSGTGNNNTTTPTTTTTTTTTDATINTTTSDSTTTDTSNTDTTAPTPTTTTTEDTSTSTVKQGVITGTVRDISGAPIADAEVALQRTSSTGISSFIVSRTQSDGTYRFAVDPDRWIISLQTSSVTPYTNTRNAEELVVSAGATIKFDFTVSTRDTVIVGTIKDQEGNTIEDFQGFVHIIESGGLFSHGAPVSNGTFTASVPVGTYRVELETELGARWTPDTPVTITTQLEQPANIDIVVIAHSSTIKGKIMNENGAAITGINMMVVASGNNGARKEVTVNPTTGEYEVSVSSGTWFLKAVGKDTYAQSFRQKEEVRLEVSKQAEVAKDIKLVSSSAKISGMVFRHDGQPAIDVWVSISPASTDTAAGTATTAVQFKEQGVYSNGLGEFNFSVPPGSYYVRAHTRALEGLARPIEAMVTVKEGETKEVELKFRSTNAQIVGTVLWNNIPVEAFVTAWSESGGYYEARSDSEGKYTLTVSGDDVWHVTAKSRFRGNEYKSSVAHITVQPDSTVKHNLSLILIQELPKPVTQRISTTQTSVVKVERGVSVTVPPLGSGIGAEATVSVNPDSELPDQNGAQVVGVGYDVTLINDQQNSVTQFDQELTISIPYTVEDLAQKGINPDDLILAYWDETQSAWIPLEGSIVNQVDGVVTATVNHLTRFAIVAAADTIPPNAPTSISASLNEQGIVLSWVAPSGDFSHIKIYRSQEMGDIGTMLITDVTDTTYTDTAIESDIMYYYTVRSVDPAGNESTNTEQVTLTTQEEEVRQEEEKSAPPLSFSEKVRGKILLQVEQNGEAWWVNPTNNQRYYLGRPDDAFTVMRNQGLGISNENISKIPIGIESLSGSDQDGDGLSDLFEDAIDSNRENADTDGDGFTDYVEISNGFDPKGAHALAVDQQIVDSVTGKIVLQVEQNGEAWFVEPSQKKRFFLGRPHDAFTIMRTLGLGISNADLERIQIAPDSAPTL